jgi:hypothetical protein
MRKCGKEMPGDLLAGIIAILDKNITTAGFKVGAGTDTAPDKIELTVGVPFVRSPWNKFIGRTS